MESGNGCVSDSSVATTEQGSETYPGTKPRAPRSGLAALTQVSDTKKAAERETAFMVSD